MTAQRAIAIVGLAGRFPDAPDVPTLFANVLARASASREVPEGRWPAPRADMIDREGPPDRARSSRACLLAPFELTRTDLPAELVSRLGPLAKLTLDVGVNAFESAALGSLDRNRIGIVLANIALPTDGASKLAEDLFFEESDRENLLPSGPKADPIERHPSALPAGLLARALGLGGGSFTLDAACASSLYAIYLACEELANNRLDAVLTGGVSLPQALYTQVGFTQLQALSPSGTCSPFDQRADGLVVGEGAGMFVLRRLEDAERDGNRIYAVIRGIGLSNDVGGSLLSPDAEGQLRATRAAYAEAGWSPDDVELLECHGTGTARGDAVELASLTKLWEGARLPARRAVLGSVKSNVGHLLTAAGAAGLCKVLAALEARTLPPSANFAAATSALAASPFRVLERAEPWEPHAPGLPRRAAVSGFGFGGINAHVLVEEYRGPGTTLVSTGEVQVWGPSTALRPARSPIAVAIVGMGAHVGALDSLTKLQHALLRGDPVRDARPEDRFCGLAREPLPGAWLDTFEMPLERFRIPPREMTSLLPQQLLMLKVAAEALDDARGLGAGPHLRSGAIVGIGLDLETTTFHLRWLAPARVRAYAAAQGLSLDERELDAWAARLADAMGPALDATRTLGALGGIVASRLAREFQLGGPSFGVSGEEGSGLRALEIAARMLQRGEADLMVAGAVDLAGDVRQVLATDALRRYSRTGRFAAFDADADGRVMAEGAAALVLKRLDDAVRDGDRVYAVLQGFGAASGAALASGAVRSAAYARAVSAAHHEAKIDARDVSLVMGHGSGDPSEDDDELVGLCRAFPDAAEPLRALSSAAATVGHAGAASGLVSVVAASLALHEQMLPPMPAFRVSRRDHELGARGFHVPTTPQVWLRDRANGPRMAGVSTVGIDGTCLHAVLASAPGTNAASARPLGPRTASLFVCRGDEGALVAQARVHRGDLESLAASWFRGVATGAVTRAVVATSADELVAELLRERASPTAIAGDVAFVFPGSGNHYIGMGRGLGAALPNVYRRLDAEVLHLAGHLMPAWITPQRSSWDAGWEAQATKTLAAAPERMILGQVAHGIAVSDAVRMFGVEPKAFLGYSLGESAGLFASRAWRDRDLMFRRTLTSPLFRTELSGPCTVAAAAWGSPPDWRVAIVNRPAAAVKSALRGTAALLIVNAPDECVVGGRASDVAELVVTLGCGAIDIEGVPTVHLPIMAPVAEAYRGLHVLPTAPPPGIRFYSGAAGRRYEPTDTAAADSILANAMQGFDFPATVLAAYADGARIFVELGPQGSCTRMIARILEGRPHLAVSACRRGEDGYVSVLLALAKLAEAGVAINLAPIYAGIVTETPAPEKTLTLAVGRRRPALPTPPARALGRDTRLASASAARVLLPATASAHGAFLELARGSMSMQTEALLVQQRLLERLLAGGDAVAPAFDRAMCLEFATGSLAKMLGPDFAAVDRHPTRVRLPAPPLMLCDRILTVEGAKGVLGPGRCVTEHDVVEGAWYLDAGRAPVCISVEAGQANLFLSAYLGIDFETKGTRVYRLLDARVVFHRDLPRVGETIRYDIRINRFLCQGDTWLFFFRFDGTIDGAPFITMYDGCAGFFSDEQLATGRGIVDEAAALPARRETHTFTPLVPPCRTALGAAQLEALRSGDLGAAFGAPFEAVALAPTLRLPSGRMHLVDRIVELDTEGGAHGLGFVHGEADVTPDAWYLTCHFEGDPVMPGTLMYECCLHTLRVLLLRMGLVAESEGPHYAPVLGVASRLRCRGQVLPTTKKVAYKIEITEIGYDPEPYVLANASMFSDGRHVVEMQGMSTRIRGLTRAKVEALWLTRSPGHASSYTRAQILAYAEGNPSECFGPHYRAFDAERRIARLPRPPFLFVDRVVSCAPPPRVMAPDGWVACELDVKPDAWYFGKGRQMPFAILLEAGLQACGWLAAYVGSALTSDEDLKFRNLDGTATVFEEIGPDAGTLLLRTRMTKVSNAGGMLLQEFDFEVLRDGRKVYVGHTGFGFFPAHALAAQVGLRGATLAPLPEGARTFELPQAPEDRLLMVDRIDALELEGGAKRLGFVSGRKTVNPAEWFFDAHFYQDPVMPGSLGLEALLQLLKVFARERFGGLTSSHRAECMARGRPHRWQYRGQVLPTNREVTVQIHVTEVVLGPEPLLVADGLLAVDGRVIYALHDLSLRLIPMEARV